MNLVVSDRIICLAGKKEGATGQNRTVLTTLTRPLHNRFGVKTQPLHSILPVAHSLPRVATHLRRLVRQGQGLIFRPSHKAPPLPELTYPADLHASRVRDSFFYLIS